MTTLLTAVARAIATANGDDYDAIPEGKAEWVRERGMFGGRYRDVNEPYKTDYDDMADAALRAIESQEMRIVPQKADDSMTEDDGVTKVLLSGATISFDSEGQAYVRGDGAAAIYRAMLDAYPKFGEGKP